MQGNCIIMCRRAALDACLPDSRTGADSLRVYKAHWAHRGTWGGAQIRAEPVLYYIVQAGPSHGW